MNIFDVLREKLEEKSNNIPIQYESNYEQGYVNGIDYAIEIVNQVEKEYNNGWIPADQPPKDDNYVLLSFENFTIPLVGRYEEDENGNGAYYIGDELETCISQDIFVDAWQPLQKRYKEE